MNKQSFFLASLIAGVVMAFLSSIPVISIANCIFCLWAWLSGILGVYLYRQFSKENPALSMGQAAGLGALAGVVGAILGSILDTLFAGASMAVLQSIPGMSNQLQNVPAEVLRGGGFSIYGLGIDLVFYVIFGVVGGILAVALIWKSPETK